MLAELIAGDTDADRKLIEPLQKERPRKDRLDVSGPRRALRDFAPPFAPTQKRESIRTDRKKFGERPLVRQENDISQGRENALAVTVAFSCRRDEEREIVDGNIGERSL